MNKETPLIPLRPYQASAFAERRTGIEIWLWGRQVGKSHTLAAWAVDRLLTRPGRLVTILSNSRENGAELNRKVHELCRRLGQTCENLDQSADLRFENMNMETRIVVHGRVGRIKVLAASPRTARGFSGDLILDEFAFHEDSRAIWEAAEPILSANADYLCRIASTPNGRSNMFYQLVSSGRFRVRKVARSDAWRQGMPIFHPVTRDSITPEEARALALDKRAYDQNYECLFEDEASALLSRELIAAAESISVPSIDEREWSGVTLDRLEALDTQLYAGHAMGPGPEQSVVSVLAAQGDGARVVAMLRLNGIRQADQQRQLEMLVHLTNFRRYEGDLAGLGESLVGDLQASLGSVRIGGVYFSKKERSTGGRSSSTLVSSRALARTDEVLAHRLVAAFEDHRILIPVDSLLREDLHQPERKVSLQGQVYLTDAREETGRAGHFWSLALAWRALHWLRAPTWCRPLGHRTNRVRQQRALRFLEG